jgi:hypothetical protein
MTADRLLDRIEPQGLDRHQRLMGWLAGGAVGSLLAGAALFALLVLVHLS